MSRTAITLKLKMRWFPDEASCWAETLYTDIDLASLVPNEDKNFGGSLVLDFKTRWRHVQAKNTFSSSANSSPFVCMFFKILIWKCRHSCTWLVEWKGWSEDCFIWLLQSWNLSQLKDGVEITYCWFSHDVTKIQPTKLLILLIFYCHDV